MAIRNDLSGVKVGDRLAVVANGNRFGGGTFTVTRVGRKYVTMGTRRFLIDGGQEDGNGVGGHCYAMTAEQYAAHEARETAIRSVRDLVISRPYYWFESLTTDQARRISAILSETCS